MLFPQFYSFLLVCCFQFCFDCVLSSTHFVYCSPGNALLRNCIEPKIDNILRKNQNGFRRNRSTTSQILTIRRILEGVRAKNLQATLIFVDFTKAFDSIHRGKMEQILLAYGGLTLRIALDPLLPTMVGDSSQLG